MSARKIRQAGPQPQESGDQSHLKVEENVPHTQDAIGFDRVFQLAPEPIFIADGNRNYVAANRAACNLTGYSCEELTSMRVGDLTIAAERTAATRHLSELEESGSSFQVATIVRKDGKEVIVESHAINLGNGLYMGCLHDISDRVAAQAKLQRSNQTNNALIDLCHAAVISASADGLMTTWNPAAEALFGCSQHEAIGAPITTLIPKSLHGDHLAGFDKHVKATNGERFDRSFHVEGLRKDGSIIPLEICISVGHQAGAKVFTAFIRDLTEIHEIDARLHDALQRLQFHVERMPLAYVVWDSAFRAREWNPAAERIFGYSREEAIGQHAYDLIVPKDIQPTVDNIWDDLQHGDTSGHAINANVRKDGSRLTCEWFNTPLRNAAGEIVGVCSMAMDISEREDMETQLRNAQRLESLGVLAGGVAHDFNSALTVILGNASLLRSTPKLPAKAIGHLELIEEAGFRASELVKHLLAYARTGRHNAQPTNLNIVLKDVGEFLRASLGTGYHLSMELASELPDIHADHGQLEQLAMNLCLNAKEASPLGSIIHLQTKLSPKKAARCVPPYAKAGNYVELAVRDDGAGMTEATRGRIFDPFFTTKPDGHGLGLAAGLGILRQHNACVLAESKEGVGTTMHIFFPVSERGVE